MEYTGQDRPTADATRAVPVFSPTGADDVQYADSGFLPADAMPAGAKRPRRGARPANADRLTGDGVAGDRVPANGVTGNGVTGGRAPAGRPMEVSHFAEAGRLTGGGRRPDSGWFIDTGQLTEMSDLPDSGRLAETREPADGGGLARGGGHPDGGNGAYPVDDWFAGYERYAGEQGRQPEETDGDRFLTRVYATPANPRQVPPDDDPQPADGHPGGLPLADYPDSSWLVARLARLRLDRWLIAVGSLAAAVAVIIAFVTAGGDAATPSSRMAQTGTPYTCVSPAPGH